jgi:hypothetical protein
MSLQGSEEEGRIGEEQRPNSDCPAIILDSNKEELEVGL